MYVTSDSGHSWEYKLVVQRPVIALNGNSEFYISDWRSSDLFISQNYGESWKTLKNKTFGKFSKIKFQNAAIGYALAEDANSGFWGLYKTCDQGATWTLLISNETKRIWSGL